MMTKNRLAYSTAQHSTAQHSTAQHSTAQVGCFLLWDSFVFSREILRMRASDMPNCVLGAFGFGKERV